jgi:hypothetical protein
MTILFLATALSLYSTALPPLDTARSRIPAATVARPAASRAFAVPLEAAALPSPSFDKLQHFSMSYATGVFAYGAARSASLSRDGATTVAIAAAAIAGVGKEILDKRSGRPFSGYDLLADALGALAACTLTRQIR